MNVLYKEASFAVEATQIENQKLLNLQFDLPNAERLTAWLLALAEGLTSELVIRNERVKVKITVVRQDADEALAITGDQISLCISKEKISYCAWSFLKMVASENAFPDHVDLDIVNRSGGEDTVTFKINR